MPRYEFAVQVSLVAEDEDDARTKQAMLLDQINGTPYVFAADRHGEPEETGEDDEDINLDLPDELEDLLDAPEPSYTGALPLGIDDLLDHSPPSRYRTAQPPPAPKGGRQRGR